MRALNIDQHIRLIPADPDSLSIGIQPIDGALGVFIAVRTATLGDFIVPVTGDQVGVLAAVCKHLLGLDADQVAALNQELTRITDQGGEHRE